MHSPITPRLPAGIAAPKFHLFQTVQAVIEPDRTAIVAGIYYTDFHTTLLEGTTPHGWHYLLSYILFTSPQIVEQFVDKNITERVHEECLCAANPELLVGGN